MISGISYAQQENIWAFGIQAGLNFNSTPPTPINTFMNTQEGCASVCDANGALLFYTNGYFVWDQTNNFMQNGFSISPLQTTSTTQGAIIIPMPDSSSKYYIFSLTARENGSGAWGRLYYSVVDMTLNNGLGGVEANRKAILVDTGLQENLTAVAGKSCNIWLLAFSQQGVLKAFNIDHNGLNTAPVQSLNLPGNVNSGSGWGSISVSPDRSKLAIGVADLTLCDFNAATGMASNPMALFANSPQPFYSVCFSPNSSKLYATQYPPQGLRQYDLSSGQQAAMINSMQIINPAGNTVNTLRLGPDGKVYCLAPGPMLSVVHQPDMAGAASMFAGLSLPLNTGTNGQLGLPNVVPHIIPSGDSFFSTEQISVSDCFTNTFLLQADTAGTGQTWDDGSTLPQRAINGPGTYWVTYSRHCDVYSDTFVVSFPNSTPAIWIAPGCKDRSNGMAVAYSPQPGYTYTWRNAASVIVSNTDTLMHAEGGNYTLHVVTPSGCVTTINVFIPEEEHHASFLADSIVCQGNAVIFSNTSDNHFTQFDWAFGDGNSSTLQAPSHSYSYTGHYIVAMVAKGPVCIDTVYRTITVDSIHKGHYRSGPDSICMGQAISFYPDTDSSIADLHWIWGDGTEMTSGGEPFIRHAYDSAGLLTVQLHTVYRVCPATTFTDTVCVYALPKIYLGPDTGLCLDGAPVLLQNELPAPSSASINYWSTGDTSAVIKVAHPGTYSLTVSSGPLGCSATESVIVHKDCYADIPNAFTPNGDGENDYFFPRQLLSRKVTRFNMQVLNRWGQLVFETNRTDGRGWDGRFNGSPQAQGVYVYLIDLTIDNQRQEKHQGNVTLIR